MGEIIQIDNIQSKIFKIRNQNVMLDRDLAKLYEVETRRLNEQVRRNVARFPKDFMFQLTKDEYDFLRSQNAILKQGRGQHPKYLPNAFTENGIAMLSSVLNSEKAIQINIQIMRVFTQIRKLRAYTSDDELNRIITSLIKKIDKHDEQINFLYAKMDIEIVRIDDILNLLKPKNKKQVGFQTDDPEGK